MWLSYRDGPLAATLRRVTAQQFVLELGRAMHALGSPSYRVEDTMDACCRALGLEGSFFSTPTAIFAALGEPGSEPKTTLLRVVPGEHDLGRLAELYAIRDAVVRREATPDQGLERLHDVLDRPPRPYLAADPVAHALAGAGAAVLLGGCFFEAGVAAASGLLVGLMGLSARLRAGLVDVLPPLSCAVVAFLVHLVAASGLALNTAITTIGAIVVLLPGLSFTTALAELAMRHLSAGSARLLGTLAVLLTMGVGAGIGDRCGELLTRPLSPVDPVALPWEWHVLGLLCLWLAFVVLLRASRNQVVWVLLAVGLGYGGARLGGDLLGRELGAFLGAVFVASGGNLFARWRRRPAAVVRTPGLLLLVPGSLGFRALTPAVGDTSASVPFLVQMMLVGGAVVAGLLMAGVLLPPPLDVEPDSRVRCAIPPSSTR
ncbi:MAG TPA: threonine/serine exporter family protein [Planctomycetota bacterium]|nr:threonine/serine exporter family protein [Planctomycetota bacterium]